jgi:hypothetical protein
MKKVWACVEISAGSLGGIQIFTDINVAIKWANEVTTEYYTDYYEEGTKSIPSEVTAKDLETDWERELPGDEMNQSYIHIQVMEIKA